MKTKNILLEENVMEKNSNITKKHWIIFCFLFFVLCSSVFIWQGIYLPKVPDSREAVIFSAEKGQGSKEISIKLEQQGLIKSGPLFRLYVLHRGVAVKLQAGDYLLSPAMTIPEIANKFVAGDIIKEKITIVEGWNLRDIEEYLSEKGLIKEEELFVLAGYPMIDYSRLEEAPPQTGRASPAAGRLAPDESSGAAKQESLSKPKDFSEEFDFLKDKPKNLGLEGYFFPDTYEMVKGESLEGLIRKILKNFDKKLTPELKDEIEKQEKTVFEVVTMASLIEKEVRSFDDKQIVSGILWKRMKSNMRLQVDATITYITGKTTTKVSGEETKIDLPFNTYKYLGLPPGPICNPGLESIRAAIHPIESDYWFYLSKPDGETVFSKTLEEHNRAKETYLK